MITHKLIILLTLSLPMLSINAMNPSRTPAPTLEHLAAVPFAEQILEGTLTWQELRNIPLQSASGLFTEQARIRARFPFDDYL